MSMVDTALKASACGLSVLPIRPNSKKSKVEWKEFQERIASEAECRAMFAEGDWFALVTGAVSKNLEVMDFDIPGKHELPQGKKGTPPHYQPFCDLLKEHGLDELLAKLVTIETASGGIHLLYRCVEPVLGNQKLSTVRHSGKREVAIETRGEGGYFLTYPTPGYKILSGKFNAIPELTTDEHEFLLTAAKALSEEPRETISPERGNISAKRPGDDYNERGDFRALLQRHGWSPCGRAGKREAWVRPGKSAKDGMSATLTQDGKCFYVFSSNSEPFREETAYTPFAAYSALEHKGDFFFAAQHLAKQGYGEKLKPGVTEKQPAPVGTPKDDLAFEIRTLAEYEPELPEYLPGWNPYFRLEQLNLLDAKGGAGKTTLSCAISALGSIGRGLYGEECEPFKTLYFGTEDTAGEFRYTFDQVGGNPAMVLPIKDVFKLDGHGLARVQATIEKFGAKCVVFDALKYYLAGLIRNSLDDMEIAPHLAALREVARDTGCSIINIRHFTKYSSGKEIEEMGSGSEQWRNSHRSQLVLRPHPDKPRCGIVQQAKGSLNSPKGEPFGFAFHEGQFRWIPSSEIDIAMFEEKAAPKSKVTMSLAEAISWLRAALKNGPVLSNDLFKTVEDAGGNRSLLFEAKKLIPMKAARPIGNVGKRGVQGWVWELDDIGGAE